MDRKKPGRKAEPGPKRRIAWPSWTGFRGMTVRDWLPIVGSLLIPLVIAGGTWWITWQQGKIEEQRAQRAQKIENQRAGAERQLEEQRAQDAALQAYFEQMSALLLEEGLRASDEGSAVRMLARARTLTVLQLLPWNPLGGDDRRPAVIEFLAEAGLVQGVEGRKPIISLSRADLTAVQLVDVDLHGADLSRAYLGEASLGDANLNDANLSGAYLNGASLKGADLHGADLSGASVGESNLGRTDLSDADLSDADLSDIYDWTEGQLTEELLAQAASLEGATMPNGQKYEDWLETPEGQDWLRKYKESLGAEKKRAGVYEDWIKTTEGKMWLKAVGEDGENPAPS